MFGLLFGLSVALSTAGATSSPIKHVVVLMMENRAFDHLLGWLSIDHQYPVEGLSEGMVCPRDPDDPSQGSVPITRGGYDVAPDDPMHDFDSITEQIDANRMDGFVNVSIANNRSETNPVSMFDSVSAPIINTLAMEYAVFDQWFPSIPGPTDCNRAYAMSGTSQATVTNFNGTLWAQQSYFDYLRTNNHTFAGYYQHNPWAIMYFEDTNRPENSQYIKELDAYFWDDVAAGDLAEFTWLQPRTSSLSADEPSMWQHPDASVMEGERLIKQVYEALRAGPKWEETLLLLTYDEHGGFYDHVPPPSEGIPNPDNMDAPNGFKFDRLGIRIPTVAISAWINKGTVISGPLPGEQPTPTSAFDATSILATANLILDVRAEPLGARMAWANTFDGLVRQRTTPRDDCPLFLPFLPVADNGLDESERARLASDGMVDQIRFFCTMSHPHDADCFRRVTATHKTQGQVSDWLVPEIAAYELGLRKRERESSTQL